MSSTCAPIKSSPITSRLRRSKVWGTMGASSPQFVCLLCQLNVEWHKNAGGLLRFPAEPEDNSPHIFCPQGICSVLINLHEENRKIYSGLNFSKVLRAFFSVAFIGNIHKQGEGEAIVVLLQCKLAVPAFTQNYLNYIALLKVQIRSEAEY